jgi:hypothetical protein
MIVDAEDLSNTAVRPVCLPAGAREVRIGSEAARNVERQRGAARWEKQTPSPLAIACSCSQVILGKAVLGHDHFARIRSPHLCCNEFALVERQLVGLTREPVQPALLDAA